MIEITKSKQRKLKINMIKKDLNQRALAELCECSECMLSREINGHPQSARLRAKIAEVLGCEISEIFDV